MGSSSLSFPGFFSPLDAGTGNRWTQGTDETDAENQGLGSFFAGYSKADCELIYSGRYSPNLLAAALAVVAGCMVHYCKERFRRFYVVLFQRSRVYISNSWCDLKLVVRTSKISYKDHLIVFSNAFRMLLAEVLSDDLRFPLVLVWR